AQRELWLYHRARWHRIYKPFGWETLELRYGGLAARLQTMYDRIVAYALRQPAAVLRHSRAIGIAAGISRHPALLPARSRNPSKDASAAPGPSMSADDGSGMSVGEAPPASLVSVELGWPVAAAAIDVAAAGPVVTALPGVTTINALGVRELGGEGDFWVQPAPLLPPELDPGAIGNNDSDNEDDMVDAIPELDEDLHCIYENSHTSLLLDYSRVTTPSRLG
ncbi:hypothetical protein IWQ56_007256, partial [Coemansia nantahalensis]